MSNISAIAEVHLPTSGCVFTAAGVFAAAGVLGKTARVHGLYLVVARAQWEGAAGVV